MKQFFLKLRTKSQILAGMEHLQEDYGTSKKMGLLFQGGNTEKLNDALRFSEELKKENKEVHLMMFLPKGPEKESLPPSCPFFGPDSFSFSGKILDTSLQEFINEPFDFLFHLGEQDNPYVEHVLAASSSKCRIGLHQPGKEVFYELMVKNNPAQSQIAWSDMLAYARMINKKT